MLPVGYEATWQTEHYSVTHQVTEMCPLLSISFHALQENKQTFIPDLSNCSFTLHSHLAQLLGTMPRYDCCFSPVARLPALTLVWLQPGLSTSTSCTYVIMS